jgi:photosystem II stability/assembly factor-like uncharacterized protein
MSTRPLRPLFSVASSGSVLKIGALSAVAGLAVALAWSPDDVARFEPMPAAVPTLSGFVSVIDSNHVWVGLAHTADGGRTWKSFSPVSATAPDFVNFPSENQPTAFFTDTKGFLKGYESVWITKDGGYTWSKLFNGRGAVGFPPKSLGLGTIWNRRNDSLSYYKSRDAGETWQKCGESPISGIMPSGGMSFVSETTAFSPGALFNERQLPGRNGIVRTDDGGCHWRLLSWYDGDRVARLTFADSSAGWLLPADPDPIARTLDGGFHWKQLKRPVADFNPYSAYLQDRHSGWLFGFSALLRADESGMYFTSDLGNTWQSISKTDLRLNRGFARGIPLTWPEGYFVKILEQRK